MTKRRNPKETAEQFEPPFRVLSFLTHREVIEPGCTADVTLSIVCDELLRGDEVRYNCVKVHLLKAIRHWCLTEINKVELK